jgi:SPP1 gp7 family putative phage head morphogenesis protein
MSDSVDPIREFTDAAARHGVYLSRYERGLLRRILTELQQLHGYVTDKLAVELLKFTQDDLIQVTKPTWSTDRLKALLADIQNMAQLSTDILNNHFDQSLPDLAHYEALWTAGRLQILSAIELDMTGITPSQLYAAVRSQPFLGVHLRDEIKGFGIQQQRLIKRAIRQGYLAGEGIPTIVRRIRSDGIDRSTTDVTRIVRTAVNHTSNIANEKLYAQNSDIIDGVRWVSTLDGRTSAVCKARDGKEYPMGKGPRPPAHPNCRSRTVPIVKTWASLGVKGFDALDALEGTRPAVTDLRRVSEIPKDERSGKIKQVPAGTTYNSWLRTQPKDFIDSVLGPTRAKLYMQGGLSLDRFVDYSGREYTLSELRAEDPEAFRRAGL